MRDYRLVSLILLGVSTFVSGPAHSSDGRIARADDSEVMDRVIQDVELLIAPQVESSEFSC